MTPTVFATKTSDVHQAMPWTPARSSAGPSPQTIRTAVPQEEKNETLTLPKAVKCWTKTLLHAKAKIPGDKAIHNPWTGS